MALIECPKCDTKVSDSAQACPKCGTAVDEKFIQKSQKQQKNRKINKFAFLIFGVILLGMLLVSLFSEEKMNEEWRDSYLKRLNLLNEEIKPGLTKVFNEALEAVEQKSQINIEDICSTDGREHYWRRWDKQINKINQDMPPFDIESAEAVENFKTAHHEEMEMDCFYASGLGLYTPLESFCGSVQDYGLDNPVLPQALNIFAIPTFKRRWQWSEENRQACIDLVLEHSQ